MKKLLTIIIASLSFLNAQTHIVPEGFSGFTVSFKHDQNVDFFGEGKFLRNSYAMLLVLVIYIMELLVLT